MSSRGNRRKGSEEEQLENLFKLECRQSFSFRHRQRSHPCLHQPFILIRVTTTASFSLTNSSLQQRHPIRSVSILYLQSSHIPEMARFFCFSTFFPHKYAKRPNIYINTSETSNSEKADKLTRNLDLYFPNFVFLRLPAPHLILS